MLGAVRFSVQEDRKDILVYHCQNIHEAKEIFESVRECFPGATFLFQPMVH